MRSWLRPHTDTPRGCCCRVNKEATMWKRCGSDKPQQTAAAMCAKSLAERLERQAAVDRSRPLAPYKQEVARSSRAPPIVTSPLPKRNGSHRASDRTSPEWCCGSVVEAVAGRTGRRPVLQRLCESSLARPHVWRRQPAALLIRLEHCCNKHASVHHQAEEGEHEQYARPSDEVPLRFIRASLFGQSAQVAWYRRCRMSGNGFLCSMNSLRSSGSTGSGSRGRSANVARAAADASNSTDPTKDRTKSGSPTPPRSSARAGSSSLGGRRVTTVVPRLTVKPATTPAAATRVDPRTP
jgi:hypothetical protein